MSLKTGLPLADADLAPSSLCSGRQRAMPGGSPSSLLNNGSSSISSLHELQCDGQVVCSSSEQSVNWLAPRPPIKGARARGLGKGSVRDLADDEELRRMSTDELVSELKRSWDESDAVRVFTAVEPVGALLISTVARRACSPDCRARRRPRSVA